MSKYREADDLRALLAKELQGKKYQLDCGHHVTIGHNFGNNIVIYNGAKLKIICTLCAY